MLRYNGGVLCQEAIRKHRCLKIVILQKKTSKRMANKIVRKTDFDVLTSKSKRFRKVFDTWNIYDYRIYDVEKRWTRK